MIVLAVDGCKPVLRRVETSPVVVLTKPYHYPWPFKVGETALIRYKVKEAHQRPVGPFTLIESKRP